MKMTVLFKAIKVLLLKLSCIKMCMCIYWQHTFLEHSKINS